MKISKHSFYIIASTLIILYLGMIATVFYNLNGSTDVNSNHNDDDVVIVLDAGHGGEDGGALANGIIEKDINLSISNMLYNIFKASGFNVITTRDSDVMINTQGDTLRERKVSDMKKRLEIYDSSENNIVISIHQNKFQQEKYYGTQIFYTQNVSEGKNLAEYIKNSVKTYLQPENTREVKPATKDIYLLHNTKSNAIIVECGFISNVAEAEKLKTTEYQSKLAYSIFMGFMDYYNNRG